MLPAIFLALVIAWIHAAGVDFRLAGSQFYDAASHTWIGAHTWWAERLVHTGGRDFVRAITAGALVIFAASWISTRWQPLRREAGYVVLAIVLSTGIVGLLKHVTNVDCPWDLTDFGGTHDYVSLFGQRAAGLPRVACFPGAHSSAGFALMCFYFILRDRSPRAARIALLAGILTGALFAFAQEARGAHFISHDLTSAAIVWFVQLAAYVILLSPRVARAAASAAHPVLPACRNELRAPE